MMWLLLYFYPDYQIDCEDQWAVTHPVMTHSGLSLGEVFFFHRQDLQILRQHWHL